MATARTWYIALLVILGVLVIVLIFNVLAHISRPDEITVFDEPQTVTLSGTSVCLPHHDTSGAHTMECAFGIQAENDAHFALDMRGVPPASLSEFATGEEIIVTGALTTRDQLDAEDRLRAYDIAGSIAVTEIARSNTEVEARHVVTGGTLAFERPANFELAVSNAQLPAGSVVLPCTDEFDYCLYYNDTPYAGTNFESAGVRISERGDLASETECLTAPPARHSGLTPEIARADTYATSVFTPIGDAGAGHASDGALYRIAHDSTCHEVEARIGTSQFANHPTGTVEEFTDADRAAVEEMLRSILRSVTFTDERGAVRFPTVP